MPIEFRCTGCKKLLRTKDDTAGKQARCPECGQLLVVPAASIGAAPDPVPLPAPAPSNFGGEARAADNPYSAPRSAAAVPERTASSIGPMPLNVGNAVGRTWQILTANYGTCLLAPVLVIVFGFVAMAITGAIYTALQKIVGNHIAEVFGVVIQPLLGALSIFLQIGLQFYLLKVARGEPAEIGDVFQGGRWFVAIVIASLLMSLMVTLGFFLLIVGGIFAMLVFWPFPYVIIDRNVGPIEGLKLAAQATEGHRWTVFVIGLLVMLIGVPVIIFTCGLGAFFLYIPFVSLLMPVIYLSMTGQPIANPSGMAN